MVRAQLCKLQKRCTRLTATSDKVYQLLAQGRWFSPGTPASSTTNTGRHDIAGILLKVALSTKIQIHNCAYVQKGMKFTLVLYVHTFIMYVVQLEVGEQNTFNHTQMTVRFVDIGGIDDHPCLSFLFTT